jgi:hypothetical protein
MWVKEIKHAFMDGNIGLILKRVKDVNFNTKKFTCHLKNNCFLYLPLKRNDKYFKA